MSRRKIPSTNRQRCRRNPSRATVEMVEPRLMLNAAWTVMVYLDADNNLEPFGIANVNQMEQAGSTAAVNIVVQMDRTPGYDSSNGDWADTRRALIIHDNATDNVIRSSFASIGEQDMGNPNTLRNFIQWGIATYPADHYLLDIWDHGGGTQGVCWDDTNNNDYITVPQLGQALSQSGVHFDIAAFDACLMAMLEIGSEIAPYADIMVASEETIPGDGFPYNTMMTALDNNPTQSATALASTMVDLYGTYYAGQDVTLSAVNLANVATPNTGVEAAVSNFASAVLANANGLDYTRLQVPYNNTMYYGFLPEFRDLGTFLGGVAGDNSITAAIRNAAQTALTAYNGSIIRNYSSAYEAGTGMSIYFQEAQTPPGDYPNSGLAFVADTQWDEFLNWWWQGLPPGGLSGHVWNDLNSNGLQDPGEPPLANDTVYLDLNNNGLFEPLRTVHVNSTNVPLAIADVSTTTSTLNVSGLAGRLLDVNLTLTLHHTYDGDLVANLVSPSGTTVRLFTNIGGGGDNFIVTTFDDSMTTSIDNASAPFTGTFSPEGMLSSLNGEDPNGAWKLVISDTFWADSGTLNSWSLTIKSGEPSQQTDTNGNYSFTGLTPMPYVVRENHPQGYVVTAPAQGFHLVQVASGQTVPNIDFGVADLRPTAQNLSVTITTLNPPPALITLEGSDIHTAPDKLTYQIVSQPSHGTVTVNGNIATYIPDLDYEGDDSFQYTATDDGNPAGSGTNVGTSNPATVSITIMPVNRPPVAIGQSATAAEDTPLLITLAGQDPETPASDLVYSITHMPDYGTLTLNGNVATYTPDLNYHGPDDFYFAVTDNGKPPGSHQNPGDLTSTPAKVTLTVTPVNDPPVANPQAASGDEDQPVVITLTGSDVETPAALLTYAVSTAPAHGTVTIVGHQATYMPEPNFNGTDVFYVTARDTGDPSNGSGAPPVSGAPAAITVTVNPVNDRPAATPESVTTSQDQSFVITLAGTDVETPASQLTYAIVSPPQHGTLTQVAYNQFRYEPGLGYSGLDALHFTVTDTGEPNGIDVLTSTSSLVRIGVARQDALISGVPYTFGGLSGSPVTVTLRGNGSGWVYNLADFGHDDPRDLTQIVLTGTDENSTLTITSRNGAALGDISVLGGGRLRSIQATTTDLYGSIDVSAGGLRTVTMRNVIGDGHRITAGGVAAGGTLNLTFNKVDDLSIVSAAPIGSLTAADWADTDGLPDSITAPRLTSLNIRGNRAAGLAGDFSADLNLSGDATGEKAVQSANIAGSLTDSRWDITGNVGSISALGQVDGWDMDLHSSLSSLRLGQVGAANVDVNGPIGSVWATQWNGGELKAQSLGSLTVKGDKRAYLNGDFGATLILTGAGSRSTLASANIAGDVTGTAWSVTGGAGKLTIGGLVDAWTASFASIDLLRAGSVGTANVTVAGNVGSVSATQWLSGSLQAKTLKTLTILGDRSGGLAGDFGAMLNLSGNGVGQQALGKAVIPGVVWQDINVHGDAGSLTIGSLQSNLTIDGNTAKVQVADNLGAVAPDSGVVGKIHVGGTASVTGANKTIRFTNGEMFTRPDPSYQLEDLLLYDQNHAWWYYNLTTSGNGGPSCTGDSGTVDVVGGTPYRTVVTPLGNGTITEAWYQRQDSYLSSWSAEWDPSNSLNLTFDTPLSIPQTVQPGQLYASTSHFQGTLNFNYNGTDVNPQTNQTANIDRNLPQVSGTAAMQTRLLGHEQVTVPQGTFIAVKGQTTITATGYTEFLYKGNFHYGRVTVTQRQTWWSVPGCGIVQTQTDLTVRMTGTGGIGVSFNADSVGQMVSHS